MKSAPFAYTRPATLDDAIEELAASPGEAKIIAGGQSLVPMLAMRLARPAVLVDLNAVGGLDTMRVTDGSLEVGATVRQRRVEADAAARRAAPLLAMALPWVGHRELRSRGTICGSLVHADPAAELPAVACCLDAAVTLAGPAGRRTERARDFFTGAMTTTTSAEEIVTGVLFPAARHGDRFGFAEVARRHGDFALAGVAVRVTAGGGATMCAFGVSDRPVTVDVSEAARAARDVAGDTAAQAALVTALAEPMRDLAGEIVDTSGDPHGSPDYRRRLLGVLAAEQLAGALADPEMTT